MSESNNSVNFTLTSSQLEIVQSGHHRVVIEAQPGSGKTRVLVERLKTALKNGSVMPHQVVAITFTEKSAAEIVNRLSEDWDVSKNRLWISTIHGFCLRLLRANTWQANLGFQFQVMSPEQSIYFKQKAFQEVFLKKLKSKEDAFHQMLQDYGIERVRENIWYLFGNIEKMQDDSSSSFLNFFNQIQTTYQFIKSEKNLVDYDDLLFKTRDLLKNFPDVCETYQRQFRLIMVDEFQDTDPIQAEIVHLLTTEIGVRSRRDLTPFILLQSLVFLTTFPAFMYYNGIQHGSRGLEWIRISHNLQYYFRVIHKFMFPLFLMVGVLLADLLFWKKKIWIQMKSYLSSSTLGLIGIVTLSTFFFGAMGDQHYYRYILHLVPLFLIVTAVFFKATFLYSKWISKIGFILVLMTSLLHYSVFNVFSKKNISYFPPIDYVYELTHPHDDLSKGLVEFFNKHAKPTDTIGIPYADHQLMFYTDFRILNINIKKNVFPEWIVYQSSWFGDVYGPSEKSDYFKAIQNQYERIETNIPDVRWSYRADPYHYQFRNHKDVPRLVIFKKKI